MDKPFTAKTIKICVTRISGHYKEKLLDMEQRFGIRKLPSWNAVFQLLLEVPSLAKYRDIRPEFQSLLKKQAPKWWENALRVCDQVIMLLHLNSTEENEMVSRIESELLHILDELEKMNCLSLKDLGFEEEEDVDEGDIEEGSEYKQFSKEDVLNEVSRNIMAYVETRIEDHKQQDEELFAATTQRDLVRQLVMDRDRPFTELEKQIKETDKITHLEKEHKNGSESKNGSDSTNDAG